MFLERRNSVIYQVAIATVIFSLVKTSCFRAKGLWHFIGGYPVICTRPPADISEQGEKNLTVPFSRGSWERNACRSPTTSFQRFSLKSWKPCVSVPRWRQGFFFWNENVRALKDALENLTKRKSTSRRILTGILSNISKFLKAWEIIRIWTKRAWNYSLI